MKSKGGGTIHELLFAVMAFSAEWDADNIHVPKRETLRYFAPPQRRVDPNLFALHGGKRLYRTSGCFRLYFLGKRMHH